MQNSYYLTINSKGQITIPKQLRMLLNLQANMKIPVFYKNDQVILKKSKVKSIEEIRKSFQKEMGKRKKAYKSLDEAYNQLNQKDHKRD